MKSKFTLWVEDATIEWIKSNASNTQSCSALVDQIVQEKRLKSVTLEKLESKLNLVLERLSVVER